MYLREIAFVRQLEYFKTRIHDIVDMRTRLQINMVIVKCVVIQRSLNIREYRQNKPTTI